MRFKGYIPAPLATPKNSERKKYEPDRGWAPIPGIPVPIGEPHPEHINATIWLDGQRASRSLAKRCGPQRVLMLGCSYTFGNGVRNQDTYSWLLNDRFSNIRFDNYAFPGYGTLQCLLTERKILQHRDYDLVIYAPFEDHINRNVGASPCVTDITERSEPLPFMLKQNSSIWFMPTVDLDEHHRLIENIPFYQHWFGDRFSALSNTLKRLCLFQKYAQRLVAIEDPKAIFERREIFWRLLWLMHEEAQTHGTKLAVLCLEDANDANNYLSYPTSDEIAAMNSKGNPLTFPPPFFFGYAGSGRNGAPDGPEFHVGGSAFSHANYMLGHPFPPCINNGQTRLQLCFQNC